MSLEIGKTVVGRIVEVSEKGLVVSLTDEEIGIVHASALLSIDKMMERFASGTQVRVSIGVQQNDGSYELSIEQQSGDSNIGEFDKEFARLNHELTNYSSHSTPTRPTEEFPSIEERMEEWIAKAEHGLARLRKNRGKRLSEEFYNNKS